MPAERIAMRDAREIIRLKFSAAYRRTRSRGGLAWRASTVRETLTSCGERWAFLAACRRASATPDWRRRFTPTAEANGDTAAIAEPDWPAVHRELKRKHVTLLIVWDEYIAANPGGYSYSRYVAARLMWRKPGKGLFSLA